MAKFIKFELKRAVTSKWFLILFVGLAVMALAISVYCVMNRDDSSAGKQVLYGVAYYETFEELSQQIETTKEALKAEENELTEGIANGSLNDLQIAAAERNIQYLETNISVMTVLLENSISFDHATAYHNFNVKNGASVAITILFISWIIVGLFAALKISCNIPSELKEGQAKLSFVLPIGKTRYSLARYAADTLKFILLYIVLAIIVLICSVIFFEPSGYYTVAAVGSAALLLSPPAAVFLSLGFGLFYIIACSAIGYIVSLLIHNNVASLLVTAFVCLSGYLIEAVDRGIYGTITFSKYLLPCTLNIDKVFYAAEANSVWVAILITLAYLIPFFIVSLIKFKHTDLN